MKYEMTLEQRDHIMGQLSEEQRHFMHHELVRGRRTLFARQLARKKCQFIPEDAQFEDIESFIEEWDYIGFTDSGEVSPHTKCECGRSLRYQHQVLHLPTNTIRYFGIEHLQLHTGIDAKAVADIMKGFDVLDGEMHEVLSKFRDGWQLGQHLFLPLPAELDVPPDIQAQIDVKLPLLDRQLARIRRRLHELDVASRKKRLAAALTYFDPSASEDEEPIGSGAENTPSGYGSEDSSEPAHDSDMPSADQGSFNFGEYDAVQGAFSFEETDNGQAAFVFDQSDNSQGAFVFDEEAESQGAFRFDEPPANPNQDASAYEEAGRKLGAAARRDSEVSSSDAKRSSPFYLSPSAQRVVDDAIKYGRISTLAISNFLIEQKLVQDTRMSTGKPGIYIAVAAYMDKLAAAGQCELVSSNSEDRVYKKNE
ncbi:DUF3895 domain-containing protein [Paenibacillus sp. LHD-38]|uniref:DUF3895 domain-containing protein n=1 Tax=Paenibacillus sp. LHD-38 TaxID=3072143 RepID=UPI00280E14D6|nr:DUF3895 domain-containing protein [Paenibacillus sp. LHD-38]MDQ8737832.1 DUF3895 domain-containing protein [Paenibacillus sp. LHD-38]